MQRVQFMDPSWTTSWGLGFAVQHQNDHIYVGHAGDCPGYQTALYLRPSDQTAAIAMDNASDTTGSFVQAIFAILDKRKGFSFNGPLPAGVKPDDYAGRYSGQPWNSESAVLPWAGGLAILPLPNNDPAGAISFLKPKGGDIFVRIRPDGTDAEEYKFVRDPSGKVASFVHFSNPSLLQSPLSAATSNPTP
jgi:hypothetical protein